MIKTAPHSTLSPQMWCIKKKKRMVCRHPDLLARICKLVERKTFGLICFPRICFPRLIYCEQEPLLLLNLNVHLFECTYKAISTRYKICFTPKSLNFSMGALHNSDFRFPVSMNTSLKMYSVSRWRKARRNKVKEKSAHILVAPIECTMQKGKKTRFRFFTFPKNGKLRCIWENHVARKSGNDGFCITKATVVCNIQFLSR